MPLDTRFTRHHPFLLESDVISLSRDFALSSNVLHDIPLRATHRLHPSAAAILFALYEGTSHRTILRLASLQKISDSQLSELLGFLNMIGALQRRRSYAHALKAFCIQARHLLLGIWYTPIAWRRPATAVSIAHAIARAITWVIIAAACVAGFALAARLAPAADVIGITIFGVTVFGITLFMHELTHVIFANRTYVRPRVLQIGLRLGIIHRKLTTERELLSALAGPAAGSVSSFLCTLPALLTHAHSYALIGASIALLHALSLIPWYGDGATFHKALRERESTCKK